MFARAGANVVRAEELLSEMLAGFPDRRGLARDILICEQDGDQLTQEVNRRLNQTFVTPIEREDIIRLVSALDDIVDLAEEVADYLGLYRIEAPMVQAQAQAKVLVDAPRTTIRFAQASGPLGDENDGPAGGCAWSLPAIPAARERRPPQIISSSWGDDSRGPRPQHQRPPVSRPTGAPAC